MTRTGQPRSVPRRRNLDLGLLALAILVLASTVARFLLSRGVENPWIAPDEHLYGLLGRSLVAGDGLRVLGETVPYYSLLYPLLVGGPLAVGGLTWGITVVQGIQALLMSAAAIPVYLWTKPLAGARYGLVAAGLTVLVPGLAYSGLLMSEALYYPVATLAVWSMAASLESPTFVRQALFLGALALALATRLQAIGLVAAFVVALGLLSLAERSTTPIRRVLPTLLVVGLASAAWAAVRIATGGLGELVGAYAPLIEAHAYAPGRLAESISWHSGLVVVLTVGIPLVAAGIFVIDTMRGRERDPGVRALVVTAVAYAGVTVLEVGAFASRFVEDVTERQLLSVVPPLFAVFAVWLHRGAPRPQPATAVVAWVVAAAALLVPVGRLAVPAAAPNSPSTIGLERLSRVVSETWVEITHTGAAALVLLIAVFVPRRLVPATAVVVAGVLVAGTVLASGELRTLSRQTDSLEFAGESRDWIDRTGVGSVALVQTGDRPWTTAWFQTFWNDSIDAVTSFAEAEVPGAMPQSVVGPAPDGRLVEPSGEAFDPPYAVAPSTVSIAGEPLASLAPTDRPGLTLWRVDPPLRVRQWVRSLKPNGDLVSDVARIDVFDCSAGRLELTVLGKQGLPFRIRVNGALAAERSVPSGEVWRPVVPAPAAAREPATCVYELESDGLVGVTRAEFVRDG